MQGKRGSPPELGFGISRRAGLCAELCGAVRCMVCRGPTHSVLCRPIPVAGFVTYVCQEDPELIVNAAAECAKDLRAYYVRGSLARAHPGVSAEQTMAMLAELGMADNKYHTLRKHMPGELAAPGGGGRAGACLPERSPYLPGACMPEPALMHAFVSLPPAAGLSLQRACCPRCNK